MLLLVNLSFFRCTKMGDDVVDEVLTLILRKSYQPEDTDYQYLREIIWQNSWWKSDPGGGGAGDRSMISVMLKT